MIYPDLFKDYPDRKGKDWVRRLPKEELKVFISIGLKAADFGKLGGAARAKSAKRDRRGRFAKES